MIGACTVDFRLGAVNTAEDQETQRRRAGIRLTKLIVVLIFTDTLN